jgi:thiol-disulfide isomerase/thioredoxin
VIGSTLTLVFALLFAGPTSEQMIEIAERLLADGMAKQAIQTYTKAASIAEGDCAECERGIAAGYVQLGQFPDALRHARRARELSADNSREIDLTLARALLKRPGNPLREKRLKELQSLLKPLADAGDDEGTLLLVETFGRVGDDEQVVRIATQALERGVANAVQPRLQWLRDQPHCGRESCLPPFTTTTLDGAELSSSDLSGRVLLLDFWATWCAPCIDSIPALHKMQQSWDGARVALISFSADSDRAALDGAIERYKMSWPQVWDPRGTLIRETFSISQFPSYVIVDSRGVVRAQLTGWGPNFPTLIQSKIDELLLDAEPTD